LLDVTTGVDEVELTPLGNGEWAEDVMTGRRKVFEEAFSLISALI
jgi:hypothetical protein